MAVARRAGRSVQSEDRMGDHDLLFASIDETVTAVRHIFSIGFGAGGVRLASPLGWCGTPRPEC
jgi:hypothetical protein